MSLRGRLNNSSPHRRDIFTPRRRITHLVASIKGMCVFSRHYVCITSYRVHAYVVISCKVLFFFSYELYLLDRSVIDVAEASMSGSRYLNLPNVSASRLVRKNLDVRSMIVRWEKIARLTDGLQYSRNLFASFSWIILFNDQQK